MSCNKAQSNIYLRDVGGFVVVKQDIENKPY